MARCTKQPPQILVTQSGRFSGRVHPCAEKNFICVKVADPGDQLLVQQDRFHCAAVFSNNCLELREINFERVGAKAACFQKFIYVLDQLDFAEFALIVERQPVVIRETKNHSRSFRRYFVVVEVRSEPVMPKCSRSQSSSPVRTNKCLPWRRLDSKRLSFQSPRKLTRGHTFQNIRVTHLDARDPLVQ